VTKAGANIVEVRDTAKPALLAQFLMSLIEAIGNTVAVPRMRKRVRDNVHIQKAELLWRRNPSWLILRVATHADLTLFKEMNAVEHVISFLPALCLHSSWTIVLVSSPQS
jgi:hypothetical protein